MLASLSKAEVEEMILEEIPPILDDITHELTDCVMKNLIDDLLEELRGNYPEIKTRYDGMTHIVREAYLCGSMDALTRYMWRSWEADLL